MNIPTLTGTIDRRILINYRADREVIQRFLPGTFTPKLVNGHAMVGICLIRLKHVRPKGVPFNVGVASENGAHRIAVEWKDGDQTKEGVFVPRRDTSSRFNSLVGGRIFPGVHEHADFRVEEKGGNYQVEFKSGDGTHLSISASETTDWNSESIFETVTDASDFFRNGSVGYSPSRINDSFEGLELDTKKWEVTPLLVSAVKSSFFENTDLFPAGSITFDNALLMRNIDHEWKSKPSLKHI